MSPRKLANRAVQAGQTVPLSLGLGSVMGRSNRRIPIRIVDSDPGGTVIVTQATTVEVVEQSAESVSADRTGEAADSPESPSVTYEDVGGSTTNSTKFGK
ncbi:hypothetical protein ACFQH8_00780 [Halomicroarcula sp. GCM10025710]